MMINSSKIKNIVISKTHTSEAVAEVLKERKWYWPIWNLNPVSQKKKKLTFLNLSSPTPPVKG